MSIGVSPGPCPTAPASGVPLCPPPNEVVCIKTKKVFQECRHTWVPNSITLDLTEIFPPNQLPTATAISCGPVFIQPSFQCESQFVPCTPGPDVFVPGSDLVCPPFCQPCTCGCPPVVTTDESATIAGANLCTTPIPTCPPVFFPGEVLRCCIDCTTHEVVSVDSQFDIIYTMNLIGGPAIRNRQTICIPTSPADFRRFFLSRAGEPGLKCQIEVFAQCTQCFISSMDTTTNRILAIDCCFTFTLIGKLFSEVELMVPAYGYCPLPPECFPPLAVCPTIIPPGIPYPPQFPFPLGTTETPPPVTTTPPPPPTTHCPTVCPTGSCRLPRFPNEELINIGLIDR